MLLRECWPCVIVTHHERAVRRFRGQCHAPPTAPASACLLARARALPCNATSAITTLDWPDKRGEKRVNYTMLNGRVMHLCQNRLDVSSRKLMSSLLWVNLFTIWVIISVPLRPYLFLINTYKYSTWQEMYLYVLIRTKWPLGCTYFTPSFDKMKENTLKTVPFHLWKPKFFSSFLKELEGVLLYFASLIQVWV